MIIMPFKVLHQTMKQKVITLSLLASVVIGSYGACHTNLLIIIHK